MAMAVSSSARRAKNGVKQIGQLSSVEKVRFGLKQIKDGEPLSGNTSSVNRGSFATSSSCSLRAGR